MTFYRDGKPQTATVTIAELPQAPELVFSLGLGLRERPADKEGGRTVIEIDRVVTGTTAFNVGMRPECVSWPSANLRSRSVHSPNMRPLYENSTPDAPWPLEVQLADGRVGSVHLDGSSGKKEP